MLSYIKLLNNFIFFIIFTVKNTPEYCNYNNKENAIKSYNNNNENIKNKKEEEDENKEEEDDIKDDENKNDDKNDDKKDDKKEEENDNKENIKEDKNKDDDKKENDKKEKENDKKEDIKEDIKEDKEDLLIGKRKEYFEGSKTIKDEYGKCNKIQDLTKYKIDNDKLKKVIDEVNKVNEEERIFIQSDTEGKVFNIISALQIANIIDINKPITVYYNFNNGNFEKNKSENSIELKLFEVNKNFKGTYIHLGDIIDRCNGEHQCLKSLLLILYIKQELEDKVKLICGNHELLYDTDPWCNCCNMWNNDENITYITRLICLTAISKGQIQYLDKIEIGNTNYILTHKVLYEQDINQIKDFLKNEMKEKKELKDCNIYDLIDVVNVNFKKYFCDLFYNYDNKNTTNGKIIKYTSLFDHLNGKIVIGDRFDDLGGYKICLENQICGHDHHKIDKCYIKEKNILFVDNYSFDPETYKNEGYQKLLANIHFFNKKEELSNHKLFNIINDKDNLEIKIIDKL